MIGSALAELNRDETARSLLDLSRSAAIGAAQAELVAIQGALDRHRWVRDNLLWVQQRAGTYLWSKQRDIVHSVQRNRRTACHSCHASGKSFTAAHVAACWLDTHPPGAAMVVTSAPTARQVRVILWKEIRRVHSRALLPGRTNQTEWYMTPPGQEEQLVAIGMKPDDYSPSAFQGIHGSVLVIFDEAGGILGETEDNPQSLWESADSLLANEECRFLAIGNPDLPFGKFHDICKPGSGWSVIHISAFDTPNFTGEAVPAEVAKDLIGYSYVEEKRRSWAPTWRWNESKTAVVPPKGLRLEDAHPLWLSKILGRFPENKQSQGLIPYSWIQAAQERSIPQGGPIELGVDVGGGGDSSTIALRKGSWIRIVHEDHDPDTMRTTGKVLLTLRETSARMAKVDVIGIGRGVVDRSKEQSKPVIGINVGEQASDPEQFANLRAELWWAVRERFERGEIDLDPEDQQLAAELCSLRFFPTSRGQIQVESKEQAKKRGISSPNRADALMLAFAPEPAPVVRRSALVFHGRRE